MTFNVRRLSPVDVAMLDHVAPNVFDDPIVPASAEKFLSDPNAVLIVAFDPSKDNLVIGFASAVTYLHPDKSAPEMLILEVGVDDAYQRKGIGKAVMKTMLSEAKKSGCKIAWLATEPDNIAALALYKAVGGRPPEKCIHIDFDLSIKN
jgi:ribosomal protein S18 acetylase RimI-like enzyme